MQEGEMDGARYEVVLTAVGEVRDADGNLVSSVPVTLTGEISAEQLRVLGAPDHKG